MSKFDNLSTTFPNEKTPFQIDVIGSITKKVYRGEFTSKIGNVGTQVSVAKHQAFLAGSDSSNLSTEILNIIHMISYLKYHLISAPNWWNNADFGFSLKDYNVIKEVYEKVMENEEKWLKEVVGDDTKE